MPFPSVTYTFTNSTTADATQVNQNFTDVLNGLSDGTKDLSVSAITAAGTVNFQGNLTLGNSASNTLVFNASLNSNIPILTTDSFDIGSDPFGLRALYLGSNSSAHSTKLAGASVSAAYTFTLPNGGGSSDQVLSTNGSGTTSWRTLSTPTIQKITATGAGTYTTPTSPAPKYIRVVLVGGGSGGNGGSTASAGDGGLGTSGGNTTFGSALLTANGGGAGGSQVFGGIGGSATIAAGPIGIALKGGDGQGVSILTGNTGNIAGGNGGSNLLGGAGSGSPNTNNGGTASPNTGAGGGGSGGANTNANGSFAGGGGGAGAYIDAIIASPSATYAYSVGAGGAGGTAGTNGAAGGHGADGQIIVYEYYQ